MQPATLSVHVPGCLPAWTLQTGHTERGLALEFLQDVFRTTRRGMLATSFLSRRICNRPDQVQSQTFSSQFYCIQIILLSDSDVKILRDEPVKVVADIKTGTTVSNALIVAVVLHSHSCKSLR